MDNDDPYVRYISHIPNSDELVLDDTYDMSCSKSMELQNDLKTMISDLAVRDWSRLGAAATELEEIDEL
jgi:hypothetical protein